ncbi:unnamed protein product [Arctogadus glacialis]
MHAISVRIPRPAPRSGRWQIFKRSIYLNPNKVDAIVLTTCTLHNFLLELADNQKWLEEQEGNNLEDIERMKGGNRDTITTFKSQIKTHLFKLAHNV